MPEQDPQKERELPGTITITPSSDKAVSDNLEAIRSEISGTTDYQIVDGEIYKPRLPGSDVSVDNAAPTAEPALNSSLTSRPSHKDSQFGLETQQRRLRRKR